MSLFYKEDDKNKNPSAIKYPDLPNSQQEPQKGTHSLINSISRAEFPITPG